MSFLSLFRPRRTQSRITSEPPLIKNSHIPHTPQTIHPSQSDSSWSSSIPRDIPPEEESRLTDSVLAKLEVRREEFKRAYFESCEGHAESRWPKLERYIATDMLPDILVLEQGSSISPLQHEGGATHSPVDADPPLLYIRAHPHLASRGMSWSFADPRMHCKEGAGPRIAHLWWDLDDPDRMHGTHGYVRRAAFTRQETVSGGQLATVTDQVLAKHAGWSCEGHRMLQNEAMLYSMFPRELMDTASPGGHPPVVPKFYGFYVPVQGWVDSDDHAPCERSRGESLTKLCRSNRGLLLMENCGDAQQRAEHLKGLTDKEKIRVSAMLKRLHDSGFSHGAIRIHNIVKQTSVPTKRPTSGDGVGLRVVDFGRGSSLKLLQTQNAYMWKEAFDRDCEKDDERAEKLGILDLQEAARRSTPAARRLEEAQVRAGIAFHETVYRSGFGGRYLASSWP